MNATQETATVIAVAAFAGDDGENLRHRTRRAAGVGFPPLAIVIIVVEVGVFVGLAFWTKTKPYTAIIVGLIFFILLWILSIVIASKAGKPIYSGMIFRIVIISILISALKSAKAWEELKKSS